MYTKSWIFFAVAALVISFGAGAWAQDAGAEEKKAELKFVGSGKCKMCHSTDKLAGTSYKVWAKAAHAKAFEQLKTDAAKESAAKHGIADPSTDPKCLQCHTTPTLKPEEGVSCERCHGAAEKYLKPHGNVKAEKRPPREELLKMGMKDLSNQEVKVAMCQECHKEDPLNEFYKPFNFDEYWAKIQHGKKAPAEAKTE